MQRDFSLMEMRGDLLDADGDEMRARSLRGALNMRSMTTRIAQARPGTFFVRQSPGAQQMVEIRPEAGKQFAVVVNDTSLEVINAAGWVVRAFPNVPWTDGKSVWIADNRDEVFIGHANGIHVLRYTAGDWSISPWSFLSSEGGEIAQPYWSFGRDVSLRPSARTGAITVEASADVFSPAYVGQRIRYGYREIRVDAYLSPRKLQGTVIGTLPPSFQVTVSNSSEFRVGEVVIGQDTNWQGLIIEKPGAKLLNVVTLQFFDGPDAGERISSPTGSSRVEGKAEITPPLPSPVWDEPLLSPARGYPRSASVISGRMVFVDFPQVPDLIALSSVRDLRDFKVGAEDDDAILRQEGDGSPRFLHAINAGDLLLLADRGCYYVPIRDGSRLTPQTFNAIRFDERGVSTIRPVRVDDGVVFIESNGESVSAAMLDGNVYLKWSVQPLTLFHHHLIKSPIAMCGPSIASKEAEKYLFIINADGTAAAMSWSMKLGEESVGFSPWTTAGRFINIAPLFGSYWPIIDRTVNGSTVRMTERFSSGVYVDCCNPPGAAIAGRVLTTDGVNVTANGETIRVDQPAAAYLPLTTVAVLSGAWFVGMVQTDEAGNVPGGIVSSSSAQIGLPFVSVVEPWPVELIDSPRIGMISARVIRMSVSVKDTTAFQTICNGTTRTHGGHDVTAFGGAPPLHTEVFRVPVMGRRDHPYLAIKKHIPGPFTVMAVGQEVQG